MCDEDKIIIANFESAIADFLKEKSPPYLMDQDLKIEWLEIIILYLIKKYRISYSNFQNILKEILEDP